MNECVLGDNSESDFDASASSRCKDLNDVLRLIEKRVSRIVERHHRVTVVPSRNLDVSRPSLTRDWRVSNAKAWPPLEHFKI